MKGGFIKQTSWFLKQLWKHFCLLHSTILLKISCQFINGNHELLTILQETTSFMNVKPFQIQHWRAMCNRKWILLIVLVNQRWLFILIHFLERHIYIIGFSLCHLPTKRSIRRMTIFVAITCGNLFFSISKGGCFLLYNFIDFILLTQQIQERPSKKISKEGDPYLGSSCDGTWVFLLVSDRSYFVFGIICCVCGFFFFWHYLGHTNFKAKIAIYNCYLHGTRFCVIVE
jgi:hypothetical protein